MNEILSTDCWNKIGIKGDRTCQELETYTHCQNCPIYASSGRRLLDKETPFDYLEEWATILAQPSHSPKSHFLSMALFRLGQEWLALPSPLLKEVTAPSPIHTLPHRSNEILAGIVNIRGEILLCVALDALLRIERIHKNETDHLSYERMIIVEKEGSLWVFAVDEIYGLYQVFPDDLHEVPAAIAQTTDAYTKAIFNWQNVKVNVLDEELLFYTLGRKI